MPLRAIGPTGRRLKCLKLKNARTKRRNAEEQRAGSKEFVEKKSKKEKRPLVEINRDFCKGCGICVAFCPKEVLELDDHEKAVVKHLEKCNACTLCELRCPDMAIEVKTG
jgi:2-oxoglutarate ferredoxin oxidoreductase subunit delta